MERRLAAILAADIVGYSKLMGEDEEGTVAALRQFRSTLFEPLVEGNGGNILKRMGDGWIVEFPSIVSAARCAIQIQRDLSDSTVIRLRIGVHIGEIVHDTEDIYGDGINIAARLEARAKPGSVLISDTAYNSLDTRVARQFGSAGPQKLKNITRPVVIWCWPETTELDADGQAGRGDDASESSAKPVIVVLPFANMSDDPEQEFFADGVSEDIITALSRFPDIAVIARNTCFFYKGKAVKAETLARELAARYVLEGSVRRGGDRIRISVQLVEANTGNQIWSERYDRKMADIFDLQDEITATVVASVPERLAKAEMERVKQKPPSDMSAYDCVIRGKQLHHRGTPEDNAEALRLLDKAIETDPHYAAAYAWKACTLGQAIALGCGGDPQELLAQNLECVHKGLSLDANDVECHRILCEFGMYRGEWDEAERHHDIAFSLNPNDPRIVAQRGELFTRLGRAQEGVFWVKKAMDLDPQGARGLAHLLARAQFAAHDHEAALASYKRIARPGAEHYAEMAACAALTGLAREAERYRQQALERQADYSVTRTVNRNLFRREADSGHLRSALLKGGMPD